MVQYDQTAYGKVTVLKDTVGIANINPFRYKGYYYDQESGMYYCHTRYYVPEWGRWLNASIVSHQDVFNAFSYCKNDPILRDVVFNGNSNYLGSCEKIASETISVQQVSNSFVTSTSWKVFGYEHRTSAGWEADGRMFTSSILRIGVSSYITHSTADKPSVFYAFTGHVETDSLSLIGETWYAGIGMKWGDIFGTEVQVETLGIAGKVKYGNFSIAVDLNLLGGLSITFGKDENLGNCDVSTTGFTIGVNFLSLAYVILAIGSLFQPSSVPSAPSYQPV